MAEMGSKGGRIGGRQRAARMTPEQRSEAASMAARTRWSGVKPVKSEFKQAPVPESPLQAISAILEKRMAELGFTEEEKNKTTAEFAEFVDSKVAAAAESLRAKQPKPLRTQESLV